MSGHFTVHARPSMLTLRKIIMKYISSSVHNTVNGEMLVQLQQLLRALVPKEQFCNTKL